MEITKLLFLAFFENVVAYTIHINLPKINSTGTNITSHLQFEHVKRLCRNRHVCKSNSTLVCTVRLYNGVYEYRNFENSCFLFLSNMCDNPGQEFSIVRSGECDVDVTSRRMFVPSGVELPVDTTTAKRGSTKANLREATTLKFSFLYDVVYSFDDHICPLRCPAAYTPVCLAANRGYGRYFRFWTFENHCVADLYYCTHWKRGDFAPPPVESEEIVRDSPLAWSFCSAHRYLQFARFSEAASSMAHYGWLQGDYAYQHIMEEYQRKPGFG